MAACARVTAVALSLVLFCVPAMAETMTMTLDNVSVNTCDTEWMEGSCSLRVVDTVVGDYTPPGFCVWFPQAAGLALMGARLEIDVSALHGITWVEVDIREVSGAGRTRLFLYEEGAANYFNFAMSNYSGSATDQTLMLHVGGFELGTIVVSAHEALIEEVRIEGSQLVSNAARSWGVMKSRW